MRHEQLLLQDQNLEAPARTALRRSPRTSRSSASCASRHPPDATEEGVPSDAQPSTGYLRAAAVAARWKRTQNASFAVPGFRPSSRPSSTCSVVRPRTGHRAARPAIAWRRCEGWSRCSAPRASRRATTRSRHDDFARTRTRMCYRHSPHGGARDRNGCSARGAEASGVRFSPGAGPSCRAATSDVADPTRAAAGVPSRRRCRSRSSPPALNGH